MNTVECDSHNSAISKLSKGNSRFFHSPNSIRSNRLPITYFKSTEHRELHIYIDAIINHLKYEYDARYVYYICNYKYNDIFDVHITKVLAKRIRQFIMKEKCFISSYYKLSLMQRCLLFNALSCKLISPARYSSIKNIYTMINGDKIIHMIDGDNNYVPPYLSLFGASTHKSLKNLFKNSPCYVEFYISGSCSDETMKDYICDNRGIIDTTNFHMVDLLSIVDEHTASFIDLVNDTSVANDAIAIVNRYFRTFNIDGVYELLRKDYKPCHDNMTELFNLFNRYFDINLLKNNSVLKKSITDSVFSDYLNLYSRVVFDITINNNSSFKFDTMNDYFNMFIKFVVNNITLLEDLFIVMRIYKHKRSKFIVYSTPNGIKLKNNLLHYISYISIDSNTVSPYFMEKPGDIKKLEL